MFRLTIEREKLGWSKAELGRHSRIHPAEIGKFESGRTVPYPNQAIRIAKVLGLDAKELFEEVNNSGTIIDS